MVRGGMDAEHLNEMRMVQLTKAAEYADFAANEGTGRCAAIDEFEGEAFAIAFVRLPDLARSPRSQPLNQPMTWDRLRAYLKHAFVPISDGEITTD